ncbi:MAG: polyphosphate kinase 2 family protein [Gemmataceae bacterium]|nr:polyphosphate kinase 2 family protein [Gemmataceae bacterium]
MLRDKLIERFTVVPGSKVRLKDFPTGFDEADEDLRRLTKNKAKEVAADVLEQNRAELATAQEMLYADDRYSVLVVLQAMDAAGKDGTIKHVFSGVNPQGCQVFSFKKPSAEELDHNFLWRYMKSLPERGRIGIFNRSYYEDVLVVKVHPELLDSGNLPDERRGRKFWNDRYDDLNNFEKHLHRNGTTVIKFFLNVSKAQQRKRFLKRLDEDDKHWKFSAADLAERAHWDAYQQAYEDAIEATSTEHSPWYVVPADDKWVTRTMVADIIVRRIHTLGLRYPTLPPDALAKLEEARAKLEAE